MLIHRKSPGETLNFKFLRMSFLPPRELLFFREKEAPGMDIKCKFLRGYCQFKLHRISRSGESMNQSCEHNSYWKCDRFYSTGEMSWVMELNLWLNWFLRWILSSCKARLVEFEEFKWNFWLDFRWKFIWWLALGKKVKKLEGQRWNVSESCKKKN